MIKIVAMQSHLFTGIEKGECLLTLEGILRPSQLGVALSALRKHYPVNIEAQKDSKIVGRATNCAKSKSTTLIVNTEIYWRL